MQILNLLFLFSLLFICTFAEDENSRIYKEHEPTVDPRVGGRLRFRLTGRGARRRHARRRRSAWRKKIMNKFRHLNDHLSYHNFMYLSAKVYQNIKYAFMRGIISKEGSPRGWYTRLPVWNKRQMIRFGLGRNSYGGLKVNVPLGHDVLWLRIPNERWFNVKVEAEEDKSNEDVEHYASGFRNLNEISPDGSVPDSYWNVHKWVPIPLRFQGKITLLCANRGDCFISGIAFGKNLHGHAMNSAIAYHWGINGGSAIPGGSANWNNDQLSQIPAGRTSVLKVPVFANGYDKLLYIVEHNSNWVGTMYTKITVNGRKVGRLRTSYQNAFSTHFNSKFYHRYIATFIPHDIIDPHQKFLHVVVQMRYQNRPIYFREIGTHDASPFDNDFSQGHH